MFIYILYIYNIHGLLSIDRAYDQSHQASYAADHEARDMALGLSVAGTTFEIPGSLPASKSV